MRGLAPALARSNSLPSSRSHPLPATTSLSLSDNPSTPPAHVAAAPARHYEKESEESVLIREVLVRSKVGDELDRKDLESQALSAVPACRPNSALNILLNFSCTV